MEYNILPELDGKDYIIDLQKDYEVRFCRMDEAEELVDFIDTYWRKNHIFVLSRELLDWQHLNKQANRYNFVIAKHRISDEIHSIMGFVPTSQFDSNIEPLKVWICIWKSRDDIHVKGLGVALYHYLKTALKIETICVFGISESTLSIYDRWNFTTGTAKQFYIRNEAMGDYYLLGDYQRHPMNIPKGLNNKIQISDLTADSFCTCVVGFLNKIDRYKSPDYYINRYYKHPIYHYRICLVSEERNPKLILFMRENRAEGHKCIRIVDYIGNIDALIGAYNMIQKFLSSNNYEYIDFLQAGVSLDMLKATGFYDRDQTNIVIPNYFEPFLRKNIYVSYSYKTITSESNLLILKGDADQDRPTIL